MSADTIVSRVFAAALVVVAFLVFSLYRMEVTVDLRNQTRFTANFYVNRRLVCAAGPGQYCRRTLHTGFSPQTLTATVNAAVEKFTPPTTFYRQSGSYQYLACGELANPGTNCGLFEGSVEPRVY